MGVMETLASSSLKIFAENHRNREFSSSDDLLGRYNKNRFLPSQKVNGANFSSRSVFRRYKVIKSVTSSFSLSSEPKADLETDEAQNQAIDQSKTVHVKFLLQKECLFGEQFLFVGDDPIFGLWDPSSALPLDWSDGHTWTVELDIPVEKSIQFKFLLKGIAGAILWQPGPDRILKTWETKNTIIVLEDWENAEVQKISEQEPMISGDEEVMVNPDMELIITDNVTKPKVQMGNGNDELIVADSSSHPEDKPKPNENKDLIVTEVPYPKKERLAIVAENISYQQGKPMSMVAENINYPKPESVTNANTCTKEEARGNANKDTIIAKSNHVGIGRAINNKNPTSTADENLVTNKGGPVLVAGLTPLPTMPNEDSLPKQFEKNSMTDASFEADKEIGKTIMTDASAGADEFKDNEMSKLHGKLEPEGDRHQHETTSLIFNDGLNGKMYSNGLGGNPDLIEEQCRPDIKPDESGFVKNDIQWGRKALQKLLSNLGFLS